MIRRHTLIAVTLASVIASCGDGSTGVYLPQVDVAAYSGDEQYAQSGERLPTPLVARVSDRATGNPVVGVEMTWRVVEGSATFPSGSAGITDPSGEVSASVGVEGPAGPVRIRAEVSGQPEAAAEFTAIVVVRPTLEGLSVAQSRAGDTIQVTGSGFSPVPEHNVVLFSGIRGKVLSASREVLRVEVPGCLPTRTVQVTAQLGPLVSGALPLAVESNGQPPMDLAARAYIDVDDRQGLTCVALGGEGGATYLLVVASTGTVGAARFGFRLRGLVEGSATPPGGRAGVAGERALDPFGASGVNFEAEIRREEEALLSGGAAPATRQPSLGPARVPAIGERRTFKVLNAERAFDEVSAVVRFVGERAVLYVDEAAPDGGFTTDDLQAFSMAFDQVIGPTVTGAFGQPSDLDGNQRVVILFTATVNELTPRGSAGFIGGFFYGLDLLDEESSNRGEIFYAMVPDPTGELSDARSKAQVLEVIPAILAHEFQHMIHFNERVLVRGASSTEAVWLSEGLAQMSEELVAREYYELGDATTGDRFRAGNLLRARRYLSSTSSVSLIIETGQGTLEERGAGWLYTLYLWDRVAGDQTLRALTQTTRTGTANVEAVTGVTWRTEFADWASALYLDDLGSGPYAPEYPSVDLRGLLSASNGSYPLSPDVLGFGDFARSGLVPSASPQHYVLVSPARGRVVLRVAGEGGAAAPPDSGLHLRVVRLF
jgi:hypothetical protein